MTRAATRGGFALPAVLIVVAVLTLVFLSALTGGQSLTQEARLSLEGARREQQAASLQARVAFLAATEPMTADSVVVAGGGIGRGPPPTVRLDGGTMRSARFPRLEITVQDEAGMVNLAQITRPAALALFSQLAKTPDGGPVLADRFGDFVDADRLKRANGAEAPDYAAAGLAPPPNRPVATPSEITGLLGWSDLASVEAWRRWAPLLTADPSSAQLNVNTASAEALSVLLGLSPEQARAAVALRGRAPIGSLEALGRAVGTRLVGDAERSYGAPNGRFTISLRAPGSGEVRRARLLLTPGDPTRPIWFAAGSTAVERLQGGARGSGEVHELPDPPA